MSFRAIKYHSNCVARFNVNPGFRRAQIVQLFSNSRFDFILPVSFYTRSDRRFEFDRLQYVQFRISISGKPVTQLMCGIANVGQVGAPRVRTRPVHRHL